MKNLFLLLMFFVPLGVKSKSPELTDDELKSSLPKIIRTCCAFGNELKLIALPFIKFTDITSYDQIGSHRYLGNDSEMNGIIYTKHGGFIDIAHMRDVADWTAFLYKLIKKTQTEKNQFFEMKLGHEGGAKKLVLRLPKNLTDDDAIRLAGKIAYDLSVWHEIATWYGNSYLPLIKERYSAFSVEDAYSNLLGAHVGMEAIRSDLPYNEAVTMSISQKLKELVPARSIEETENAMNSVKNLWWTNEAYIPSGKVLLKREFVVYGDSLYPRLLPDMLNFKGNGLPIISNTALNQNLDDYYDLKINLNYKFPYKRIFLNLNHESEGSPERTITQRDFQTLINEGTSKNRKKYPVDIYQFD